MTPVGRKKAADDARKVQKLEEKVQKLGDALQSTKERSKRLTRVQNAKDDFKKLVSNNKKKTFDDLWDQFFSEE